MMRPQGKGDSEYFRVARLYERSRVQWGPVRRRRRMVKHKLIGVLSDDSEWRLGRSVVIRRTSSAAAALFIAAEPHEAARR